MPTCFFLNRIVKSPAVCLYTFQGSVFPPHPISSTSTVAVFGWYAPSSSICLLLAHIIRRSRASAPSSQTALISAFAALTSTLCYSPGRYLLSLSRWFVGSQTQRLFHFLPPRRSIVLLDTMPNCIRLDQLAKFAPFPPAWNAPAFHSADFAASSLLCWSGPCKLIGLRRPVCFLTCRRPLPSMRPWLQIASNGNRSIGHRATLQLSTNMPGRVYTALASPRFGNGPAQSSDLAL